MIRGVRIRNFKGIRSLDLPRLSNFHVLVGPNASGKSTFLQAIDFVRDCLADSPEAAMKKLGITNFKDLTWRRKGGEVEIRLALDMSETSPGETVFYRLTVGHDSARGVIVRRESLHRIEAQDIEQCLKEPDALNPNNMLLANTDEGTSIYVLETEKPSLTGTGSASKIFPSDNTNEEGHRNVPMSISIQSSNKAANFLADTFQFGKRKTSLGLLPPDTERYPTANAARDLLLQGIRYIRINSDAMREPCPATSPTRLSHDGANLPKVVRSLLGKRRGRGPYWLQENADLPLNPWLAHIRYALPDLENIGWGRRPPDNAEYLLLRYTDGLETPSWLLSDGTLRMLALSILPFLEREPAIYMVEEPENGVHPQGVEIILSALSEILGAQTFLATHSPLVVQRCPKESLLCFTRDDSGVHITPGDEHPKMKDWDGTPDLGTIFAVGILQ